VFSPARAQKQGLQQPKCQPFHYSSTLQLE
jgi:hypothetical protein